MKLNEYVCISDLTLLSSKQIEAFAAYLKFLGYNRAEDFWERRPAFNDDAVITIFDSTIYGEYVLWTDGVDTDLTNRISYEEVLRMVAIGEAMTHEC